MKHFILFKFRNGTLDAYRQQIIDVYDNLARVLPGTLKATVHFNCIQRDSNMDVMVEMDLDGHAALMEYLQHPLHQAFAQQIKENLAAFVSFDYIPQGVELLVPQ